MFRSRLMIGVALLALLGILAGCAADLEQPPEATSTLERTVEETMVVSEQTAEEASPSLEQPPEAANTFTLKGWVTVDAYRYDAATGTYVHFYHDESSNTITTIGLDWIENQLGDSPATDPAKWISLSNDTDDPSPAAWAQLGDGSDTEITTLGMARAAGTYTSTGVGAWTIVASFTATGGVTVQTTGLQWVVTAGSDGNLMAANHFTAVTLATDDTLTITWTLSLS